MLDLKYFLEFQIVQGANSTRDGQVGIYLFLTLLYTLPLKKYEYNGVLSVQNFAFSVRPPVCLLPIGLPYLSLY